MKPGAALFVGAMVLALAAGGAPRATADEEAEALAGAAALEEAEMGAARSGPSSREWDRKSVPNEPKPRKVGKIPFPEFNLYPDGDRTAGVLSNRVP
jgi:hypothetical protein